MRHLRFSWPVLVALSVVAARAEAAPPKPVVTSTAPASPANNNSPSVKGTSSAGVTIRVYATSNCSGSVRGTGTATAQGSWSVPVSVANDSTTTFYARASDASGDSPCSTTKVTYVEDSSAPGAPALTGTSPASPSSSTAPQVLGTAEASSTVRIYTTQSCSNLAATGTATALGTFAISVSVTANKTTKLYATATDAAGNVSGCSAGISYTNDNLAPAQPVLTGTTPASPSSSLQPTLRGTAEASANVDVFTQMGCAGPVAASGKADAAGAFAIPVTVTANATTRLTARARDAAGNVSACSASFISYTHDAMPPATPVFGGTYPPSPGSSLTPAVYGSTDAGAAVDLFEAADCAGTPVASAIADGGGLFSFAAVAVAANATTTFTARARDTAGNGSPCSAALSYTEDSIAPEAPVLAGTSPASPSNVSTQPTLNGTAEPGAIVVFYALPECGSVAVGSTVADAAGSFSLSLTVPANATTTLSAQAYDAARNWSPCSADLTYTHDAVAPAPPVLASTSPASPTNTSTTPALSGTAEPGAFIDVYTLPGCAGGVASSGGAGPDGAFSVTVAVAPDTTTTLSVLARDAAGNASGCSNDLDFTHDATPPSPPVFSGITAAADQASGTLSGRAESGSSVTLFSDADCTQSVAAGPGGSFAIDLATPAATTTYWASATDAAGNVSSCSARGITFAADHPECPDVPDDLAITRPPLYYEWMPYNQYLLWKDNPTLFSTYLAQLAHTRPDLVGPGGWFGENPFTEPSGSEWGPPGQADNGTSLKVYGAGTPMPANIILPQGVPDPSSLQARISEHLQYMGRYAGISNPFIYIDFGTQLLGNRGTCVPDPQTGMAGGPGCTGFWNFYWNHWGEFADAGMLPATRPPEPGTWLRQLEDPNAMADPCYCCALDPNNGLCDQSCDQACIADLKGLSFSYYPNKPDYYGPYHRYSVDVESEGWSQWWPQILKWNARAGFRTSFIDNVYFTNCWNEDCQDAYRAYLASHYSQAEIDRYFTVTTSLQWNHSFEAGWYHAANGDWANAYGRIFSGKLSPDVDGVGGEYSARLDGPGEYGTIATFPAPADSDYDFTVHYKTDPGVDATVTTWVGGVPTVTTLPASESWTSVTIRFFIPKTFNVYPVFKSQGRLWLDELWLSNVDTSSGQEVDPYPARTVSLYPGKDPSYAPEARFSASVAAWDSMVDERLQYLKNAVQSIPEGQGYKFITNSYFPRRAAEYFTREGQGLEAEYLMQEVGYPPGRYDVGDGTSYLRGIPVTSPVLMTNVFDWKWDHSKRFADEFAYALHLPVAYPTQYAHNADSVTLAHAEAAAFGGGAATELIVRYYESFFAPYLDPTLRGAIDDATVRFFDFVRGHKDLYSCLTSFAEIGVVLHDQPDRARQISAIRLANAIAGSGLTFDVLPRERVTATNLRRFRMVVLSDVDRLGEAEAQLYLDFMNAGGLVVVSGASAAYDDLGRYRTANPHTIWPPVALGPGIEQHPIGKGWLISAPAGASAADVSGWMAGHIRPDPGAFPGLDPEVSAKLRVAEWSGYARLVAHFVNFDVPHGASRGGEVTPLTDLVVKLPLPPGLPVPSSVTLHSPEGDSEGVKFTVAGGTVSFVIPSLHIYTIASIE